MPDTEIRVLPASPEGYIKTYWRPVAAWTYLIICLFDFILAPIATMSFFAFTKIVPYVPWTPLTLQGGGLIHLSFGAIIGIYTWSRTKEKELGVEAVEPKE